ncbi:LytR/AlgR family response regulator transcription factor [Aquimarina sp. SS2-1]|uniref:LytR/AlgR family response regulator transcription factor n=1 Tax=Aquimarina besae TaxID=3342247 RepID=UPI00366F2669
MIKYIIVDDEHIAHGIIKRYCDLLPNMKLVKNCYDALEAFEYVNSNAVDIIFLDINMPQLKGFDFLKTLPSPPKVIVTTAYSEYALEGYDLNITDYLLKPFSLERFLKAVNKAVAATTKTTSLSILPKEIEERSVFLKSNKKYTQVFLGDIQYLESAGNYIKVVTIKQTITVRDKITDLLETLPSDDFIQVHKSFAVAKKHIKSIEGNRILIADHIIPIGTTYKINVTYLLK